MGLKVYFAETFNLTRSENLMKSRFTVLLALCVSTAVITACGQKGPLYLPKDEAVSMPAKTSSTSPGEASGEAADQGDKKDSTDSDTKDQ